jgi:hypothetical protein
MDAINRHDGKYETSLIAPCGMNCSLCVAYQAEKYDINTQGFRRKYCPGCLPRGKNCLHMGDQCALLRDGRVRFCFECASFPCKRLKVLDKRYRIKYHMSMIENLSYIQENGMDAFLRQQAERWKCAKCDEKICCHNGLCLNCDLDTFRRNKKYRWGER